MPNLPDIIEIGYSRKRLLVLLAGGIILTAGRAAMAFHLFPDMHVDAFYTAVGYFGVLFFGFGILKMGWLLVPPGDRCCSSTATASAISGCRRRRSPGTRSSTSRSVKSKSRVS